MIKTLRNLLKQDKERFVVPRGVQDVIPIKAIYDDGIFQVGRDKFSKTYKFSDINYAVASREDKEAMFLEYSELLNSLDSGATTKITINNRRLNRADFEKTILLPLKGDALDEYREEYNRMLLEKATGANSIIQEKYITISVCKKNVEEARNYFARVGADLIAHFGRLGSKCVELEPDERLRIFHDFYRAGEETEFRFDIKETRRKGHDFKDFICPDSMEFTGDYFKIGERYGRVLFLREYASYIKDSMVAEMTDLNRNLMMSIDVIPVPTDEAVREAESRLLGVETNATNWQRRQNANNNFSAQLPYDIEQQRNGDLVGWISIADTNINYPVMQSVNEPNFYLKHGFDKAYSDYGCPYVQEDCDVQEPSDNLVIYGHHMSNGSMFAHLEKFKSKDFWSEHRMITFNTLTDRQEYEIVAVFRTVVYTDSPEAFKFYRFIDAESANEFDDFIAKSKELSFYDTGVTAEYGDKLITLSTCEYSRNNSRLVVVAKHITEDGGADAAKTHAEATAEGERPN